MNAILLPLTREEVAECRDALGRLERQGLIRRDETGRWRSLAAREGRCLTGVSGGGR